MCMPGARVFYTSTLIKTVDSDLCVDCPVWTLGVHLALARSVQRASVAFNRRFVGPSSLSVRL